MYKRHRIRFFLIIILAVGVSGTLITYWQFYRAEDANCSRAELKILLRRVAWVINPPAVPTITLIGDSRISSLAKNCEFPGYKYAYFGLAGSKTTFWRDLLPTIKLPETNFVFVWLAVNDLIKDSKPPVVVLKDNILNIVTSLSRENSKVILLGQIPIQLGWPVDGQINTSLLGLDELLKYSIPPSVGYIDLYSKFEQDLFYDEGELYSDGLHLSRLGDQFVCQLMNKRVNQ